MIRWKPFPASRLVTRGRRALPARRIHHESQRALPSKTRNIGIIAHIDAGKTTTTERMLYFSGFTRRLGDVDDGSTVTDFLPAERARGITIQSAAITFSWPPGNPSSNAEIRDTRGRSRLSIDPHSINLIDTPGHADFTFEVVRSLRVLDGAVCILDAVAGVEAQTEKVWYQASQYQIPRIVFVNKLDRDGAAFQRTVKEIGGKLHVWPALCTIPWWRDADRKFCGVGDVVGLRALLWDEGADGRQLQCFDLQSLEMKDTSFLDELKRARMALVERLSEHDDEMVEKFLEYDEDHLAIPEIELIDSLRRCIQQFPQKVAPVYAGASFRNIGVQPLLDSVVDLLPSPSDRPPAEIKMGSISTTLDALQPGELSKEVVKVPSAAKKLQASMRNFESCALAFKVVHDAKRGVLVYVRVYHGTLKRNTQLYNTNLDTSERCIRLLRIYADEGVEIPSIQAGQIGVIAGFKHARTGDTLVSYQGMSAKSSPPAPLNTLQLRPIDVPPPVFFTSIEPDSLSEEKHINEMLAIMLREDPSLSVSVDAENGQTHLAGMGELHLEIAKDRLINDFKAKATIGKIDINYREAIESEIHDVKAEVNREIGGRLARASAHVSKLAPLAGSETDSAPADRSHIFELSDQNLLIIYHPAFTTDGHPDPSSQPIPSQLSFPTMISSLRAGVTAALSRGPSYGFPIHSTQVTLMLDPGNQISAETTSAALNIAAREAVQSAMQKSNEQVSLPLMEPVMHVTISAPEDAIGPIAHDLSAARGGSIISLDEEDMSTSANAGEAQLSIDVSRIYAPPDPFGASDTGGKVEVGGSRRRNIVARVPLREMVGYLKTLRSLTGGRGTFVMSVEGFEKVAGSRLRDIVREMRGY